MEPWGSDFRIWALENEILKEKVSRQKVSLSNETLRRSHVVWRALDFYIKFYLKNKLNFWKFELKHFGYEKFGIIDIYGKFLAVEFLNGTSASSAALISHLNLNREKHSLTSREKKSTKLLKFFEMDNMRKNQSVEEKSLFRTPEVPKMPKLRRSKSLAPVGKRRSSESIVSDIIAALYLTLTRPISLPPHTPVAQKIADKRWLIANSAKNMHLFI